MSQVSTDPSAERVTSPRRPRRRTLLVGAAALAGLVAVSGGAVAAAGGLGIWRSGDGMVHIEPNNLDVIYLGQRISPDALAALNARGKGLFTATDVDTASGLNATRAFDTQAEADAYDQAYRSWLTAEREGKPVQPWSTVAPVTWVPPKP